MHPQDWSGKMPEHFGNPLLEQRKLLAGEAYVERDDQNIVQVSGEDAKSWLHSLLTQDILNLAEGESTEALLLTPQGHIEHQLKVVIAESGALLIVDSTRADALISWLEKMRFRSKVEVSKTSLKAFGLFVEFPGLLWRDSFSIPSTFSVSYNPNRPKFNYFELISEQAPNLEPTGLMALRALRIAAGRPEISDVDDKSLPHEFDWLQSAVHLSKGCYRGQESVSKIHNLGHPPRRLVILNLESGDDLPSRDDLVLYQDKLVGKVLSSALHYELGSVALALVARNTPYLDLLVEIAGRKVSAHQQVLVPADAGKAANLPRPSAFKLSGKRS
jgi:folate-binding protein YgfZ